MNQLTNLSATDISAQHEQDSKDLTRILPASKKVYIQGSRADIQVPMRAIELTDTPLIFWSMTLQACIPTLKLPLT